MITLINHHPVNLRHFKHTTEQHSWQYLRQHCNSVSVACIHSPSLLLHTHLHYYCTTSFWTAIQHFWWHVNPFKPSGVKWLHFKGFRAILVKPPF